MSDENAPRVFTIGEANSAIPELKRVLPRLRGIVRTIDRTEERLDILELVCDRSVAAGNPDLEEFLATRVQFHQKVAELDTALEALRQSGYLIGDIDRGIVHFLSRKGDETVLLCWREGERRVSHWHALTGGAAREEERYDVRAWPEGGEAQ
jgi:hypothetical protein